MANLLSVSKSFCTKAGTGTDKHTRTHTESVNKNALAVAESQLMTDEQLLLQHAKFAKTLAAPCTRKNAGDTLKLQL